MEHVARLLPDNNPGPVRVIAVTSGKGGVGKTNVSINLATALANRGQTVMLMDADLGLANVDVVLGLHPEYNLSHVVSGEKTLQEIIVEGPSGVLVVPASSGVQKMAELNSAENAGLIRAFSDLTGRIDTLVIDTAAGIANSVISFCRSATDIVVVVCDEPASITDAYALIKVLNRDHKVRRFKILANMVQSSAQGSELYTKLFKVANRFLDINLEYIGMIPQDEYLRKAVQKQWTVVNAYPRSRSASAFMKLAASVVQWERVDSKGNLEFFFERLVTNS
ncbi:MAG: MinD/ParA family protein [Gammaproteobacteria bacterium]|nr:MinD/ParA family protein [Gammaproteobacteria bacterium]